MIISLLLIFVVLLFCCEYRSFLQRLFRNALFAEHEEASRSIQLRTVEQLLGAAGVTQKSF